MRLNRFLAAAGLGSRRGCEALIREGRVTINGRICTALATDVREEDFVKVNGKRVLPEQHFYVLLHKPRGYLCTASDEHERRTVFELLPRNWPRLFHVGRLDKESAGLLILTNDGDLSLRLTHPRFKIEKEYDVLLDKPFDFAADRVKLLKGVRIPGGLAHADSVQKLSPLAVRVVLRQGLKRQIRLMFYELGYEVKELVRTRIGPLRIEQMRPGEWRFLMEREIASLKRGGEEKRERAASARKNPPADPAGEAREPR